MYLKARLCIELDESISAEMYISSYSGAMVIRAQNFSTSLYSKEEAMTLAKEALELQVEKAYTLLGDKPTIKVYKINKEYEEIFDWKAEDEIPF